MKKITGNGTKRYWYLVPVLFILLGGCEKNHSDIDPEPDPVRDKKLEQVEITVERPGNGAGIRYVDVVEAQAYTHEDIFMTREHQIDFMVYNGSSTGINFITPDNSAALGGFGQGRDVRDLWEIKNAGTFIKLPSGSPSHEGLFDNLTSALQLRETLAELYKTIPNMPGYSAAEHGPGRVIEVVEGDILLFRSAVRNIQAIIKVTDHEPGNAGSISFIAKLDRMNEEEIEAPASFGPSGDPIEFNVEFLGATGGRYIDLTTLDVYTEAEAESNAAVIDLTILEGNNSNTNFITIDNDAGFGSFNTNLRNRLLTWEDPRNEGEFIRLTSSVAHGLFDQLGSTYEDIKRAYDYLAIETSPSKRETSVGNGEVILFYSPSRDTYVAMRIIAHIKHAASRGELTALVKIGLRNPN